MLLIVLILGTASGCAEVAEKVSYALTDSLISTIESSLVQSGASERFESIQKENILTYHGNGLFKVRNNKTKLFNVVDINCHPIPNVPVDNTEVNILPNGLISVVNQAGEQGLYDYYGNNLDVSYTNVYSMGGKLNEKDMIYTTTVDSLSKYSVYTEKVKADGDVKSFYKTTIEKIWTTPEANKLALLPENKIEKFGDKIIAYDNDSVRILRDDTGKVFYLPLTDIQFKLAQNGLLVYKYKNYLTIGDETIDLVSDDYQLIAALNTGAIVKREESYYLVKHGSNGELESNKLLKNIEKFKNLVISYEEGLISIINQNCGQRLLENTNVKSIVEIDNSVVIQTENKLHWIDRNGNIKCSLTLGNSADIIKPTIDLKHIQLQGSIFNSDAEEVYRTDTEVKLDNIFISKDFVVKFYNNKLDIVNIHNGNLITSREPIEASSIERFQDYLIIQNSLNENKYIVLSTKGI